MMKGNGPATIEDFIPGIYVRGASRKLADGRFEALTVNLEPKLSAPKIEITPEPKPAASASPKV